MRILCSLGFVLLGLFASAPARAEILISPKADDTEIYAARELQRYFHQLTGTLLPIVAGDQPGMGKEPLALVGSPGDWPVLQKLAGGKQIPWTAANPGPQGYVLKTLDLGGRPALVIAGAEPIGTLYGVYGLLQDHLGIGFYLDGDVLPPAKIPAAWPALDEVKTPAVAIRGVLPWTNFPQSPSSYSWADWKFILDQMARMRMNFLHIHNYEGQSGHNEMFANFEVNGKLSRGWMPTARSGHSWGGSPGWEVSRYRFGATDLFDDADFGAECGLHNDRLDDRQVFRKGIALFQQVIDYAHRRGIKIGLGLDLDLIPKSYKLPADDPAVIKARATQLATDYPNLDYLLCFQSEEINKVVRGREKWRGIFDQFHTLLHRQAPGIRLAVSGWGIDPKDVETLPADVICAPIAPYSAKFESGAVYGKREYWGCPWLERDMQSSEYYYPYNIDLSDTVKAWQGRAPNMTGFYCLTWRLADAVSPKVGYIARAPWDDKGTLKDAETVYHQFAEANYGKKAADPVTAIINQNEPYASGTGECSSTPPFGPEQAKGTLFNLSSFTFSGEGAEPLKRNAVTDSQDQHGGREAGGPEGKCLGYIQAGDWTAFGTRPKLEFNSKWTRFTARVASDAKGGKIEVHLDAPDGPPVGEALVANTGGWNKWVDVSGTLKPTSGPHAFYLVYAGRGSDDELAKAESQLKTLDAAIAQAETPAQRYHLGLLRNRIAAERDHLLLNLHFTDYDWGALPGVVESWVKNFTGRVTDVSSLGNVVSVENRYIQKNYLIKEHGLRRELWARPPANLAIRGTKDGVQLTWLADQPGGRGFFVYRDGKKVSDKPLPPTATGFTDKADGVTRYTVTTLLWDDRESPPSLPVSCPAGGADHTPPQVVVISPPTTVLAGQPVEIKARLLDTRGYDLLSATLCYRTPGVETWTRLPMTRRVKAVFTAVIPPESLPAQGIEYYIEAADGDNVGTFPAGAPAQPLSLTVEPPASAGQTLEAPAGLQAQDHLLHWSPVAKAFTYRIYRSKDPAFTPGPDNYLTYVAADAALQFEDAGEDFWAKPLQGNWYYRVTAVNRTGGEGNPSPAASLVW